MRTSTLILVFALTLTEEPAQIRTSFPIIRRGSSATTISAPGTPTGKSFLSANGKYQVAIDDAETPISCDIKIRVTMAKVGHPNPTVIWRNDAKGLPAGSLLPQDLLISDDGEFFLLAATQERWTLFRKNLPPVTLGNGQLIGSANPFPHHFDSLPNDLIAIDQIENKPIVRVWRADHDRWDALMLRATAKSKSPRIRLRNGIP